MFDEIMFILIAIIITAIPFVWLARLEYKDEQKIYEKLKLFLRSFNERRKKEKRQ
ncbi:MAG: hypothetical protein U9M94_01565 [Patescibacteria group bacterium]|nr:hypothetical protein [Patescibacteria group bacterium]